MGENETELIESPGESHRICAQCLSEGLGDLAEETTHICRMCGNFYCENHTSEMDSNYCSACTVPPKLEVVSTPLIDENGTTHQGRHINVTGETWFSQTRIISEMNDEELPKWIDKYKMMVHDAEKVVDYRRTVLSMLEFESGERRVRRGKNLVYTGRNPNTFGDSKISVRSPKTNGGDKVAGIAAVFKAAGVTKEMLLELLKKAGKTTT